LLLVVTVSPSGALQAEFLDLDFIQPIHHLVFEVFNLVFEGGDLSSEPISGNLQVFYYPSQHVNFDLTGDSGGLFLI
jgi:hypothetical protein